MVWNIYTSYTELMEVRLRCVDIFSAFGIPEQHLDPRQPRSRQSQMDAYSKQTDFIEISLKKPTQLAHSDPKPRCRPIIENVMECGELLNLRAVQKVHTHRIQN